MSKRKTAEQIVKELTEEYGEVEKTGEVYPFSRYDDCNASITVYFKNGKSAGIGCSSVRKANKIKQLCGNKF